MTYRVTKIIDNNTIEVFPHWEYEGQQGTMVTITGYVGPKIPGVPGYEAVNVRLRGMIFAKDITLSPLMVMSSGELLGKVLIDSIDVSVFFPEYK